MTCVELKNSEKLDLSMVGFSDFCGVAFEGRAMRNKLDGVPYNQVGRSNARKTIQLLR